MVILKTTLILEDKKKLKKKIPDHYLHTMWLWLIYDKHECNQSPNKIFMLITKVINLEIERQRVKAMRALNGGVVGAQDSGPLLRGLWAIGVTMGPGGSGP